jgi:hypothetical protein
MDQSGREDPKLSEVKAVLHRLQGLPNEPESADFQAAGPTPRRRRGIGVAGIAIAATAVVVAVVVAFSNVSQLVTSAPKGEAPKTPPETTPSKVAQTADPNSTSIAKASAARDAAKEPPIKAALEAAAALLNGGRVQAARQRLLAVATDSSPEVALALARSYDPNVLAQIPGADASPDVAEATRWYRAWHAAAVKQGLALDRLSLERIIASMQR